MCLHKGTAERTIETNIHYLIEKRLDFFRVAILNHGNIWRKKNYHRKSKIRFFMLERQINFFLTGEGKQPK